MTYLYTDKHMVRNPKSSVNLYDWLTFSVDTTSSEWQLLGVTLCRSWTSRLLWPPHLPTPVDWLGVHEGPPSPFLYSLRNFHSVTTVSFPPTLSFPKIQLPCRVYLTSSRPRSTGTRQPPPFRLIDSGTSTTGPTDRGMGTDQVEGV